MGFGYDRGNTKRRIILVILDDRKQDTLGELLKKIRA